MSQILIFGLKKLRVKRSLAWVEEQNQETFTRYTQSNAFNEQYQKIKKSSMMRKGYQAPTIRMVRCIIFGEMRKMSGAFGGKLHLNPI